MPAAGEPWSEWLADTRWQRRRAPDGQRTYPAIEPATRALRKQLMIDPTWR